MPKMINTELFKQPCPCCSGNPYQECCQPFHEGTDIAQKAEQLMRSRFSAFALGLTDYLKMTWADDTCPTDLEIDENIKWINLHINGRKKGRKKDQEGWVTFIASYEINGAQGTLHEKSYFIRDENNHWRYVDGEIKS